MKKIAFFAVVACMSLIPCLSFAAEVQNLKVSQEGDKAVATYDLIGGEGEMAAGVSVTININGEVRPADQLSLTGDFGKNIKVGKNKKIIWQAMQDLPKNYDGDIKWDVKSFSGIKNVKNTSAKPGSELKTEDKEDGPTLDETLKYIQDKVSIEYTIIHTSDSITITNSYTLDYNNCNISINHNELTIVPKYGSVSWKYFDSVSLNDINPASIIVAHSPVNEAYTLDKVFWNVYFEPNKEKLIKRVMNKDTFVSTSYITIAGFVTDSQDSAERVAKALKHAIQLCNKNKKQELF